MWGITIFRCKLILVILVICLGGACSLRMPSSRQIPFQTLYVDISSNQNGRFIRELKDALCIYSGNVFLVESLDKAEVSLNGIKIKKILRQVPLNVPEQSLEYEAVLAISFYLVNSKGQILIPKTTLSTSRRVLCPVLINADCKNQIESSYNSMQKEIMQLLVYRITSVKID